MTVQVTGKNLDIGEALRAYVADRIEQSVEKYVGPIGSAHVRIEKEHGEFLTNCSIALSSGLSLESRGQSHDAYASAEQALERLEKRVRRYKRRLKNHHANAAKEPLATEAPYYVLQTRDDEPDLEEDDNPVVIAETQTVIRELPVSDAVMALDLADRPFLVFRNASNARINVVYRRTDGNIGWIDLVGMSSAT